MRDFTLLLTEEESSHEKVTTPEALKEFERYLPEQSLTQEIKRG